MKVSLRLFKGIAEFSTKSDISNEEDGNRYVVLLAGKVEVLHKPFDLGVA
jgi:hypothetical protein